MSSHASGHFRIERPTVELAPSTTGAWKDASGIERNTTGNIVPHISGGAEDGVSSWDGESPATTRNDFDVYSRGRLSPVLTMHSISHAPKPSPASMKPMATTSTSPAIAVS